jgi:aspartyl/asparaginyl beta-hydroxylase (cupin superfamily)
MNTMQMGGDARVNDLMQMGQRAAMAGRRDEAARAWEQVLTVAPEHPQALYYLGQHALYRQDMQAARALLERAEKGAPKEPGIPLNLSFVFRAMGDANAEANAITRALIIDPYFYPALLSKGMLFERIGNKRGAAQVYRNVLKISPLDDQVPPSLRAPMAHARDVVQENAAELEAFLREKLGPIRDRHASEKLDRFDECKDASIGTKKIYVHQPALWNFPRLPAIQYFDRELFPWLKDVEATTPVIREELQNLLEKKLPGFVPYVDHPDGVPLNQWADLHRSEKWSAYFLWKDGQRNEEHCALCPKTVAALEKLPLSEVPGYSPCGFFSTLQPHARIPPHTGVTNVRSIVHLPLIIPGNCYFRVGNDTREWKEGEAWVFDDTIEHEAWNDSDKLRVIFIFDIWNPHLSMAERDLVSALLVAEREYYGESQADFSH